MKDEKKQMLKNITVVLLLTVCCILLFYQLNKQSAVWKKNVTLLSVNQKAVEEEWSGISNRPAPEHSGCEFSYAIDMEKMEPISQDVHVWTTKQDTYMVEHRDKVEQSFSLYMKDYKNMKLQKTPDKENPQYEYSTDEAGCSWAQISLSGSFWCTAGGAGQDDYERKEKAKLPSIEKADKACKKVLDFFELSYSDNEFLKKQGTREYEMDEGVYHPKLNVLLYEKMIEGIPTFNNGYYFEYDMDGINMFAYRTAASADIMIAEDKVSDTIYPKDMISPNEVKNRFEDTSKASGTSNIYKNYKVEDVYLSYHYQDVIEKGDAFDEWVGKFVPGWILRVNLEKYDFETQKWSEEELYYFYPLDGTKEYVLDGYTWGEFKEEK